jgi:S1-C subfamily serine protease
MDDPALLRKLPPIPHDAVRRLPVMSGLQRLGYGVPISANEMLVKWSLVSEADNLSFKNGTESHKAQVSGKDEEWDLAILKCEGKPGLGFADLTGSLPEVSAGTLLMARDEYMVAGWGIASDSARTVLKERFAGAMMQPERISVHCGPYPKVIPHTLPLFAADACAPVFNFEGKLVGIHIARISRTAGVAIPLNILKSVIAGIRNP